MLAVALYHLLGGIRLCMSMVDVDLWLCLLTHVRKVRLGDVALVAVLVHLTDEVL